MTHTVKIPIERLSSIENANAAYKLARRGKRNYQQVIDFDKDYDENIRRLCDETRNGTYRTGEYDLKIIHDARKDRLIAKTKDFRDRVWQWMVCRLLVPHLLFEYFSEHSHAAIAGKGTHSALNEVLGYVKELSKNGEVYAYKFDVKQFFKSVDRTVLKRLTDDLLASNQILAEMIRYLIDNVPDVIGVGKNRGIPIGNLFSQYAANIYLTPFDRWLESKNIKFVRYMDDIIIFSNSIEELKAIEIECEWFLKKNLYLEIKQNHQIFPVSKRGIDFVGYRIFSANKVIMRKDILLRYIRTCREVLAKVRARGSILPSELSSVMSRFGWILYCSAVTKWKLFNNYVLPILKAAKYNRLKKVYKKLCQNKYSTHTAQATAQQTLLLTGVGCMKSRT